MKLKILASVWGLALGMLPLTGLSYAFESSAQFARWKSGDYIIANDVWGKTDAGAQTLWANSGSNWGVITDQAGKTRIESYPHVEYNAVTNAVDSLPTITSSFDGSAPTGSYDFAYDIWLNRSAYEVMIWNQWVNTKPIAKSYNAKGHAIATYTNVSIDGISYDVYTGTGGSGHCMSFLRHAQTNSGTINITHILQWIPSTGWYKNPSLHSIQNGWEIINTTGQQNFTMNSYSVTVTTGDQTTNGTPKTIDPNSGMAPDVKSVTTTNNTPMK